MKAYIVNSFTENNYGGNKAGVVLCKENPQLNFMKSTASRLNFSETAFIIPSNNVNYDYELRFFTPEKEVELCGHATIASFFLLHKLGIIKYTDKTIKLKQKTKAGILNINISVDKNNSVEVFMEQGIARFYEEIENLDLLAQMLSISRNSIGIDGHILLPQIVSTGLKDIILPVKSLQVLKDINPDFNLMKSFTDNLDITGIHVFTLETENGSSDTATRNFAPSVGIPEESATGTSNGALCAYLMKNKVIPYINQLNIKCEQGYYMKNPSSILCQGTQIDGEYHINVGGNAVLEKAVDI